MPLPECLCGEKLYAENTKCLSCGRVVGWCDACQQVAPTRLEGEQKFCGHCDAPVAECFNRSSFGVCDGLVEAAPGEPSLCRRCRVTTLVPDASDPQQVARWGVLEAGKRRLLVELDAIGLDEAWREGEPPLRFRFAADTPEKKVTTGHASGAITINLKEADPVHREAARQDFNEPQRTVIGHLRHEFGHYLELRLFGDQPTGEAVRLFGDPAEVDYQTAISRHYAEGPPADWRERHITAYASMHPWEDFAATASFYLDLRAVLDTLASHGAIVPERPDGFEDALIAYQEAALVLNEVNRAMGLTDLMPHVVAPVVADKLRLIDSAIRDAVRTPCGV